MRICVLVLALAACADDPGCPDPDQPKGARLQCHMVQFLDGEAFADDAIVDLNEVDPADLATRDGWRQTEPRIFDLGAPALYTAGQRIILGEDGSLQMITFVAPEHAVFVQSIKRAADGTISNPGAVRIPK
jgi:hypothetical protein